MRLFDRIQFHITFPDVPSPVTQAWVTLSDYLNNHKCLPEKFEVSQIAGHTEKYHSTKRLKLASYEIEKLIVDRNLDAFEVDAGNEYNSIQFKLKHPKNLGRQTTFYSIIANKANAPNDWGPLLEQLMTYFIAASASQFRGLYKNWQNANCLEASYERLFGTVPNGFKRHKEPSIDGHLPGRTILDTSLNPGRAKELYSNIYFYPSAEIWLGPDFWQYAKCTKEEALAADFFIEKRDTPNYLYLKCWPEPFTRPDGEQGRMQQKLWQLFFHEDCEWPPGSGTICDEPMYGPPELMPDYKAEDQH